MKFPKENTLLSVKIKEARKIEDYKTIYKLQNEVINEIEYFKTFDCEVLDYLLEATYFIGDVNKVVMLGEEYLKNGYESFSQVYYMLLSCLVNVDIFQSVNLIRKFMILNDSEIKSYYTGDEAHYASLIRFESDEFKNLSLVLCNFVMELSKESVLIAKLDREYLFYRFYDVVNLLNELGFVSSIVLKLSDDIRNIFMLEV